MHFNFLKHLFIPHYKIYIYILSVADKSEKLHTAAQCVWLIEPLLAELHQLLLRAHLNSHPHLSETKSLV